MRRPSYPKAEPVSIVTEIRTGKSPHTHGTLMGFAPLAASAVPAIMAGAASTAAALPATMPGGDSFEYFAAQSGGELRMKILFQSLPGTLTHAVPWQMVGDLRVSGRYVFVRAASDVHTDTGQD